MGLIDEAIGEFQLASKDSKRAVECASMLASASWRKACPQLAIKWYRKGLEMPAIKDEEHLGLLYDLASAYMETGDAENAQKAFTEVYGMNSTYRDVSARIKQLEDARNSARHLLLSSHESIAGIDSSLHQPHDIRLLAGSLGFGRSRAGSWMAARLPTGHRPPTPEALMMYFNAIGRWHWERR